MNLLTGIIITNWGIYIEKNPYMPTVNLQKKNTLKRQYCVMAKAGTLELTMKDGPTAY